MISLGLILVYCISAFTNNSNAVHYAFTICVIKITFSTITLLQLYISSTRQFFNLASISSFYFNAKSHFFMTSFPSVDQYTTLFFFRRENWSDNFLTPLICLKLSPVASPLNSVSKLPFDPEGQKCFLFLVSRCRNVSCRLSQCLLSRCRNVSCRLSLEVMFKNQLKHYAVKENGLMGNELMENNLKKYVLMENVPMENIRMENVLMEMHSWKNVQ